MICGMLTQLNFWKSPIIIVDRVGLMPTTDIDRCCFSTFAGPALRKLPQQEFPASHLQAKNIKNLSYASDHITLSQETWSRLKQPSYVSLRFSLWWCFSSTQFKLRKFITSIGTGQTPCSDSITLITSLTSIPATCLGNTTKSTSFAQCLKLMSRCLRGMSFTVSAVKNMSLVVSQTLSQGLLPFAANPISCCTLPSPSDPFRRLQVAWSFILVRITISFPPHPQRIYTVESVEAALLTTWKWYSKCQTIAWTIPKSMLQEVATMLIPTSCQFQNTTAPQPPPLQQRPNLSSVLTARFQIIEGAITFTITTLETSLKWRATHYPKEVDHPTMVSDIATMMYWRTKLCDIPLLQVPSMPHHGLPWHYP